MEQEFKNYLKEKNKSEGTIGTYVLNIKCYIRWLNETTGVEFSKLYRENIQDYISYLRNNKKTKLGTLTGFYLMWYGVGRFIIEVLSEGR